MITEGSKGNALGAAALEGSFAFGAQLKQCKAARRRVGEAVARDIVIYKLRVSDS
jgi:hypothetical protein